MFISTFELFTIGIGPSSSHTVGPMRAARRFAVALQEAGHAGQTAKLKLELFGSLAFTGKGHGAEAALMLGLEGEDARTIDIDAAQTRIAAIARTQRLRLLAALEVPFNPKEDIVFHRREKLPLHSNGMRFNAFDSTGQLRLQRVYYSVGGGFLVNHAGLAENAPAPQARAVPYPYSNAKTLLAQCHAHRRSISALMMENEKTRRSATEVQRALLEIWHTMQACIQRGCTREGVLPGGLHVKRRAPTLHRRLTTAPPNRIPTPLLAMDWVNLWALAVNEENAAGGRVVTAPTNGAAGIIPAVLQYYHRFIPGADEAGTVRFLLTAGAIGALYQINASISGAAVGCQGEVGVACSMAAGALAEVQGGTPEQVENAAEIGMEHNLGLTCDPIGGLVQVPCIERNAMGAVQAINAVHLSLSGDGQHFVSLDKVIATMRATGQDMSSKYKETARGGLAVNIIEC